jgi:Tfp pilus assembly protein PilF
MLVLLTAVVCTLPAFFCTGPAGGGSGQGSETPSSPWLNVYDTSARYVGMDVCRGCHPGIYETFMQTGMGQSFGRATRQKSAADFTPGHALVYDSVLDYYYRPYWQNDSLYIMEYRLSGRDTVHRLVQRIDYVVGSGQHTNSHIFSAGGYVHQAPITFYTQKKRWDLAPGFEDGASSRFRRMIQLECMTCHNAYPGHVAGSENKYTQVMGGIDCERCHGPGSLHVYARQNNPPVDTSKTPDYTIVNPKRLSAELQNNICQRCHLQGIAVLNDGKTFYDFRPGMKLSEVMNVFMPLYEGGQDKMIMASHVERMKKSDCYLQSGKMSCITCHNPHISVKFTPRTQYINACQSCHGGKEQPQCTETATARNARNNDCITCHMPRNGSIDIPHVAVTDHYIRRRPLAAEEAKKISAFLGMKCYNNDHPDPITTARSFMEFYERYTPSAPLLDSALHYLDTRANEEATAKQNRDYIRVYYLKQDYARVTGYAQKLQPAAITDAWTAYRVGEAYFQTDNAQQALPWYQRASALMPYAADFNNKYGTCLLALGRNAEAKTVLQQVLKEVPNHVSANTNIGFLYMQEGNNTMAYDYMMKANTLDPDYEQNLLNLAVWHYTAGQPDKARMRLEHLLRKHPQNERARAMLLDLDSK